MAITPSATQVSQDQQGFYVRGTLAFSGSYSTGGDTLDFTTLPADVRPVSQPPAQVWVCGSTGDAYSWLAGTSLANGKIKVNTASNTELAAGAYPARITGDTNIYFEAVFKKLL